MKPISRLIAAAEWPLIIVMGVIFALSTIGLAYLWIRGIFKDTIEMEVAKVLLQVGVVTVSGTLLSLLVTDREQRLHQAEKDREDREAARVKAEEMRKARQRDQEDVLKATLGRITSSYNDSKLARRNMRALGVDRTENPARVRIEQYDDCMAKVNAAQLELEVIISDVGTNKSTFKAAATFIPNLEKMEGYLGALIKEYEKVRPLARAGNTTISLDDLPSLSDFLGGVKGSLFQTEFSGQHREVREAIRKDLVTLTADPR